MFNIVTLCGSTKFKDKFIEIQKKLTLKGNVVISLSVFTQSDNEDLNTETLKMLDKMHKQKIGMCDEIFVINKGGYIGKNTLKEIKYAKSLNKKISYLE